MKIYKDIRPSKFDRTIGTEGLFEWLEEYNLEDYFDHFCEEVFNEPITEEEFNDFLRFEEDYIKKEIKSMLPRIRQIEIDKDEEEDDEDEE